MNKVSVGSECVQREEEHASVNKIGSSCFLGRVRYTEKDKNYCQDEKVQ